MIRSIYRLIYLESGYYKLVDIMNYRYFWWYQKNEFKTQYHFKCNILCNYKIYDFIKSSGASVLEFEKVTLEIKTNNISHKTFKTIII